MSAAHFGRCRPLISLQAAGAEPLGPKPWAAPGVKRGTRPTETETGGRHDRNPQRWLATGSGTALAGRVAAGVSPSPLFLARARAGRPSRKRWPVGPLPQHRRETGVWPSRPPPLPGHRCAVFSGRAWCSRTAWCTGGAARNWQRCARMNNTTGFAAIPCSSGWRTPPAPLSAGRRRRAASGRPSRWLKNWPPTPNDDDAAGGGVSWPRHCRGPCVPCPPSAQRVAIAGVRP